MTPDYTVRVLGAAAVAELASLRRAWTQENAAADVGVASAARADDSFEARFEQWCAAEADRRVYLAAFGDDGVDPIGMVNLAVFERMPQPGRTASRWCYLANAFVLAAHRNRGVGSRLLLAAQQQARELGAARIVLSPSPRSAAFYARHGFGPATMLLAQELG